MLPTVNPELRNYKLLYYLSSYTFWYFIHTKSFLYDIFSFVFNNMLQLLSNMALAKQTTITFLSVTLSIQIYVKRKKICVITSRWNKIIANVNPREVKVLYLICILIFDFICIEYLFAILIRRTAKNLVLCNSNHVTPLRPVYFFNPNSNVNHWHLIYSNEGIKLNWNFDSQYTFSFWLDPIPKMWNWSISGNYLQFQ